MCGIFGEVSLSKGCLTRVIDGIASLEHRGYDSMGIVYLTEQGAEIAKIESTEQKRKTAQDLWCEIADKDAKCSLALSHTRWATCGEPSVRNAHPHRGTRSYIVHNGNIVNVNKLRTLVNAAEYASETDSEVLVRLIDELYGKGDKGFTGYLAAIQFGLSIAAGANSFVLFNPDFPEQLFCASKGGPLLVGKTADSVIVASDPTAFLSRQVRHEDLYQVENICVISHDCWKVIKRPDDCISVDLFVDNGLNDYPHFMLKEIHEQPQAIRNALAGRIDLTSGNAHLGGLMDVARDLRKAETFHFVGCGTAYNACLYGARLFNRFGMDARPWIASEFIYSHPFIKPEDAFIFVSQSGETADTIEVIKEIKMKGNICLGVVNVPNSRIATLTDAGVYTRSGVEKGVASTKAFLGMLSTILLYGVFLARQRKMTIDTGINILKEAQELPALVEQIFAQEETFKSIAEQIMKYDNLYFLGRSLNYVIAEEGALKLKEISYRHAEAYPLGEMKHGPLALISPRFCSLVIAPQDSVYSESMVNIREILCRQGPIFLITSDDDESDLPLTRIKVPSLAQKFEFLYPFLTILPLQLIAYYIAVHLGLDPDKPRNLAKSVTVN